MLPFPHPNTLISHFFFFYRGLSACLHNILMRKQEQSSRNSSIIIPSTRPPTFPAEPTLTVDEACLLYRPESHTSCPSEGPHSGKYSLCFLCILGFFFPHHWIISPIFISLQILSSKDLPLNILPWTCIPICYHISLPHLRATFFPSSLHCPSLLTCSIEVFISTSKIAPLLPNAMFISIALSWILFWFLASFDPLENPVFLKGSLDSLTSCSFSVFFLAPPPPF